MTEPRRFDVRIPVQPLLVALCALVFLANAGFYWERTIDDAYISFRYARNFAAGYGLRFNPGDEPVEGFTNFLWTMGSAGVIALGGDPMFWAKVAGMTAGAGCLALAWRLCAALRAREDLLNVLPPLLLATSAHFAHWAVQGLETLAPPLAILAATVLTLRETDSRARILWSPLAIVAAFMVRPDTVFAFLPLAAYRMVLCGRDGDAWKRFALWATYCAIGLAVYNGWRLAYFGDLLPNTWYAKSGAGHVRGFSHLYEFYLNQAGSTPNPADQSVYGASAESSIAGRAGWIAIAVVPLLLVAALGTLAQRILVAGQVLANAVYVVVVGGDWMPGFRFLMIALPFVAMNAVFAVDALESRFRNAGRRLARLAFGIAAIAAIVGQFRVDTAHVFYREPMWMTRDADWMKPANAARNYGKSFSVALEGISDELLQRTARGSSIFMSDIGFPGWVRPDLEIVDVDGLTNRFLAGAPSVRDSAAAADPAAYVMRDLEPDYLLAFAVHSQTGGPPQVYPPPVAKAVARPEFARYAEVWTGLKSGRDVRNHLYARDGVEPPTDAECIELLKDAARENPRVARMAEILYRECAARGFLEDREARAIVERAIDRLPRDGNLIAGVLFHASNRGDLDMARTAFEASRRANPEFEAPWRMMAGALRSAGRPAEADALMAEWESE